MTKHEVGTRQHWLAARSALLEREKQLTRRSDELHVSARLPWVPVDESYTFQTSDGPKTLAELFDRRSQLLVYHLMFGPMTACPASAVRIQRTTLTVPSSTLRTTM